MEGITSHLRISLVFVSVSASDSVFSILVGVLLLFWGRCTSGYVRMHLSCSLILSFPVSTISYLHRKGVHFLK